MPLRIKLLATLIAATLVGGLFAQNEVRQAAAPIAAAPVPSPEQPAVAPSEPTQTMVGPTRRSASRPPARPATRRAVFATTDEGRSSSRPVISRPSPPKKSARNPMAAAFPAQYEARQVAGDPATAHWALIIGINKYAGSTTDTIGSVPDAKALRAHLLSLGWRSDHILLLTDGMATADNIVRAVRWLASKTTGSSVAVFHYAGHEMPLRTSSDGDSESRDVAIWATDNKLVVDGDLGRELGKVRAARMWVHFATCRAGGFNDAGIPGANRIVTYSSPVGEYSYEDPRYGHSVFGYHTIVRGMRERRGDANGNGIVTVEEAFRYARPRVETHTSDLQHPFLVDRFSGEFSLKVPPKPKPPPQPSPTPTECPLVIC